MGIKMEPRLLSYQYVTYAYGQAAESRGAVSCSLFLLLIKKCAYRGMQLLVVVAMLCLSFYHFFCHFFCLPSAWSTFEAY